MKPPSWATHKALFCGIVPVWFADQDPDGCTLAGRGWLADTVLLPIVQTLFQLGAAVFEWEAFPIHLQGAIQQTPQDSDVIERGDGGTGR